MFSLNTGELSLLKSNVASLTTASANLFFTAAAPITQNDAQEFINLLTHIRELAVLSATAGLGYGIVKRTILLEEITEIKKQLPISVKRLNLGAQELLITGSCNTPDIINCWQAQDLTITGCCGNAVIHIMLIESAMSLEDKINQQTKVTGVSARAENNILMQNLTCDGTIIFTLKCDNDRDIQFKAFVSTVDLTPLVLVIDLYAGVTGVSANVMGDNKNVIELRSVSGNDIQILNFEHFNAGTIDIVSNAGGNLLPGNTVTLCSDNKQNSIVVGGFVSLQSSEKFTLSFAEKLKHNGVLAEIDNTIKSKFSALEDIEIATRYSDGLTNGTVGIIDKSIEQLVKRCPGLNLNVDVENKQITEDGIQITISFLTRAHELAVQSESTRDDDYAIDRQALQAEINIIKRCLPIKVKPLNLGCHNLFISGTNDTPTAINCWQAQDLTIVGCQGSATINVVNNESTFSVVEKIRDACDAIGVGANHENNVLLQNLTADGTISFDLKCENECPVMICADITKFNFMSLISAVNKYSWITGVVAQTYDNINVVILTSMCGHNIEIMNFVHSSPNASIDVVSNASKNFPVRVVKMSSNDTRSIVVNGFIALRSSDEFKLSFSGEIKHNGVLKNANANAAKSNFFAIKYIDVDSAYDAALAIGVINKSINKLEELSHSYKANATVESDCGVRERCTM
jgi:hypothetical protein